MKILVTIANKPEPKTRQELITVLQQAYMLIESACLSVDDDNIKIHDNEVIDLFSSKRDLKSLLLDMTR